MPAKRWHWTLTSKYYSKLKKWVFVYADCPYLATEYYYDLAFTMKDHEDLAFMLKNHKGAFALSSKAKKELRKLYRSNQHYMLGKLKKETTCLCSCGGI